MTVAKPGTVTVGNCTSSNASDRANRALPVVDAKPIRRRTPTTLMSTPVEMRWRRFWAFRPSHLGTRCCLFDRVDAHARPPSGTGPSARPYGLEEGNDLGDQRRRRDEEHDQRLQHRGQGEWCLGNTLHRQAAGMQRPE